MKKQHQQAMNVEEQIENLKSLGLTINDEQYAKKILNDISYFRLIKAFSLGLKHKTGRYKENVVFTDIVELYLFNSNVRQLIFSIMEMVEINVRCRIGNYFSKKYGVLGYYEKNNFRDENYHNIFIGIIEKEIKKNEQSPFVKNFQNNYEGGEIPLFALLEILSFGTLAKFFKNLKNEDKKAIATEFGMKYTYLESWLANFSHVRNVCAHYGRLYNISLKIKPKMYYEDKISENINETLFGTLLCLKRLIGKEKQWKDFISDLDKLFKKNKKIDISKMGFPKNWKSMLKGL